MTDDLNDVIRIDDPKIDTRELVRHVADNLRAHGFDENIEFPQFDVVPPHYEAGARFPAALYHDLEQATLAYGRTWVQVQPVISRVPLLARLKNAFHRLVVFYVNLYAERQMIVNAAILRVLNRLVKTLDQSESEIISLRREVDELRARLDELERGMDNVSKRV